MVYAFYDFEGVDFAGKTTLAMLLADSIGGEYIHCPMVELTDKQKELINSMSLDDRFNFYINENSRVSKHVETTRSFRPVVVDGYIFRTVATHSVYMDKELSVPDGIILPDKIIYLHAEDEELKRRIEMNKTTKFTSVYDKIGLYKKTHDEYQRLFSDLPNVLSIDSTDTVVQTTFNVIKHELGV